MKLIKPGFPPPKSVKSKPVKLKVHYIDFVISENMLHFKSFSSKLCNKIFSCVMVLNFVYVADYKYPEMVPRTTNYSCENDTQLSTVQHSCQS